MPEYSPVGKDAKDQHDLYERDEVERVTSSLAEVLSYDDVRFDPESEGSTFLLYGDRGRAVVNHDGALVVAAPGCVFTGQVLIYADATFVGVRFDGEVRIESAQATVIFIGCIFRYDEGPMVVLENLAQANFVGCRFGPRASTVAGTVVIQNTAAATRVNLNGCSNVTGLALGTVTQFGVTT